jgi:uncharacterized protein YbjT (DUF2867 family)
MPAASKSVAHERRKSMYVVLGATGNSGSVVAETLLSKGEKVRAVGRSKDRLAKIAAFGAEPFVADQTDSAALTRAFDGARAVYFMAPPNVSSPDYAAYQAQLADAASVAAEAAKLRYMVALSSYGAQHATGCGPISTLHSVERRLERVAGLNVLFLRAGYFMENTLPQVDAIKNFGAMASPLKPDAVLPMIATRDIGAAAADALLKLDFSGHQTRELQGQRDVTYPEVAKIIGAAIGKPDLGYMQAPKEQVVGILASIGFSQNFTQMFLEMCDAINDGRVVELEPRSEKNTTPTSFETFVKEVFVPAYRGQAVAGSSFLGGGSR